MIVASVTVADIIKKAFSCHTNSSGNLGYLLKLIYTMLAKHIKEATPD
jgi:hypothetical protein